MGGCVYADEFLVAVCVLAACGQEDGEGAEGGDEFVCVAHG